MKPIQLDHRHHSPSRKKCPLVFLAHDMLIPMNVGSLFRIADMFAIQKIYLSGNSPVPPNRKIRKTSRGADAYVPFSYETDPLSLLQTLKKEGFKIISLEITSKSIDIKDLMIAPEEKTCLILGSENTGVDQEFLDLSDTIVSIPMLGHCSSTNVAIACAIATYEITNTYASNNHYSD
ncbi:MAG: TrmH family RNA methyltransferase [Chlamydiia bacterium]|nr:TrmH family RNA methyltransferase [Chlamydiia bacterium]